MYRKLPRAQRLRGEGPGLGCGEVSRPPAQSGERKKSPGPGCGKAAPRHRRAKDESPGTCGCTAPPLCRAKIGRRRVSTLTQVTDETGYGSNTNDEQIVHKQGERSDGKTSTV